MRVAFSSVDAAPEALDTFWPDAVVSISSPGRPVGKLDDRPHLHLTFSDIERRSTHAPFKVLPGIHHIEAFLDFVDHHRPTRLLVHCRAGLSRSPAIATVAAVRAGHDPAAACSEVRGLVPHAQPNRLILDIATDLIGIDLITPALATFTYARATYGSPDGERAGLCVLFGASQ